MKNLNLKKNTRKHLVSIAVLALTLFCSSSFATIYETKTDFIKRNIPAGSKMSKVSVSLSAENLSLLKTKWKVGYKVEDSTFIIGKDESGKINGVVYFFTVNAPVHKCYHKMAIALKADGSIKEIAALDIGCEIAMNIATESFLGQFKNKVAKLLTFNKEISGITKATESSEIMVEAVNAAMGLYTEFIKTK